MVHATEDVPNCQLRLRSGAVRGPAPEAASTLGYQAHGMARPLFAVLPLTHRKSELSTKTATDTQRQHNHSHHSSCWAHLMTRPLLPSPSSCSSSRMTAAANETTEQFGEQHAAARASTAVRKSSCPSLCPIVQHACDAHKAPTHEATPHVIQVWQQPGGCTTHPCS